MNDGEVVDDSESPIPLETLGDVQRALAKVVRQAHKGSLPLNVAHLMTITLGTLAKVMQDRRDSKWLPIVKELHRERQQQKTAAAEH